METGFIRGLVVMHRRDEDIARIADEMKNAHVVSRKDLRMLPERRVVVEQYERRSEQGIEPTIVRPEVDIACAQCLRDRREYRRHPDGACLVVGRHDNIEFHSGRVLRRRRAELADWQRWCPRSTTGRAAKPCASQGGYCPGPDTWPRASTVACSGGCRLRPTGAHATLSRDVAAVPEGAAKYRKSTPSDASSSNASRPRSGSSSSRKISSRTSRLRLGRRRRGPSSGRPSSSSTAARCSRRGEGTPASPDGHSPGP